MLAINLKVFKDKSDGVLYIAEGAKEIPFEIKRVYFIDKVGRNSLRGFHAHKKLQQVIFCLRGSFELDLYTGKTQRKLILDSPEHGIYIGPKVWHSLKRFSKDCLVAVFASDYYKESDYIRDFVKFRKYI